MNADIEKQTILKIIQTNQGGVGIESGKLMQLLYERQVEPKIAKALINSYIEDGSIKVWPYGNDSYSLSDSGILWLRQMEHHVSTANGINNAKPKSKFSVVKSAEFWSWVVSIVVGLIVIWEFVIKRFFPSD